MCTNILHTKVGPDNYFPSIPRMSIPVSLSIYNHCSRLQSQLDRYSYDDKTGLAVLSEGQVSETVEIVIWSRKLVQKYNK